jgi:hypothetical protein
MITCKPIEECAGYKSLLASVDRDEGPNKSRRMDHDYRGKLAWVVDRAKHYGEKLGVDPSAILDAWESNRDYWYMNYYQNGNQPLIDASKIRVFETVEDLKAEIFGKAGFRCPACSGVSTSPYRCNSGLKRKSIKGKKEVTEVCDWKVYGLFMELGKGAFVFVKSELRGERIFMPIHWEPIAAPSSLEPATL